MKENQNPQDIIYHAWMRTEKPLIYKTSDGKGNEIIKEVHFCDPVENKFYDDSYRGICNVCGKEMYGGIPAKKIFSSHYMDWPLHKEPQETHVCRACAFCIVMNPAGRVALFRYPLVAGKMLHLCNRKQFREYLLHPPEPPFVLIFPTSQKKHLFAKSKISYSKKCYFCNLEEMVIPVGAGISGMLDDIEAMRGIGFTKQDIVSSRISGNVIKKYALASGDYERILLKFEELHKSEMFPLALEVAQKMEEAWAQCYLDLTPKTK